jgi:endonuclease YncB( thermonuclease family)
MRIRVVVRVVTVAVAATFAAVGAASCGADRPAVTDTPTVARVIDGDTVVCAGAATTRRFV